MRTRLLIVPSVLKKNPIWPVRFVFLRLDPVVINLWFLRSPTGHGIGQNPDGVAHRMGTPVAQLPQPCQCQRVSVAWAGAMKLAIIMLDLVKHILQELRLPDVHFLDYSASDPLPFGDCRLCHRYPVTAAFSLHIRPVDHGFPRTCTHSRLWCSRCRQEVPPSLRAWFGYRRFWVSKRPISLPAISRSGF